jgi:hypothetical protein
VHVDAVLLQVLHFLAAPAKDVWVATFQADDCCASLSKVQQQLMDLGLRLCRTLHQDKPAGLL